MTTRGRGRPRPTVAVAALVALISVACGSTGSGASHAARPASTTTSSTLRPATTTTTTPGQVPANGVRVAAALAPAGYSVPGASWIGITPPGGPMQLAAVFRPPPGHSSSPLVVVWHGSSGLPKLELGWAPRLAAAGFVVVAGCYLSPAGSAASAVFMPCPGLADSGGTPVASTLASATTLLDGAASLPGVRPGAIGVMGFSLGANLALSADDRRVQVIVADSGHRTTPGTTAVPVLLLGMTTDPNVDHGLVLAFEAGQRAAGRSIDAHYYPGTGHVTIFGPPPIADDATGRIVAFLQQHLG